VFSPPGGIYASAQNVTISDMGATIYYTTDGSTPTTSSAVYSAPIAVATTETIQAIAIASGHASSPVASAAYGIQTPTPTLSLAAGIYPSAQTVTISDTMAGATIYWNFGPPNTSSNVYSGPVTVSQTETLEAIAVAPGYSPSVVASAFYIIGAPFTVQATTTWLEVSPGGAAAYPLTVAPASGISTIPVASAFPRAGCQAARRRRFHPIRFLPVPAVPR
jgi:hypothetical protein